MQIKKPTDFGVNLKISIPMTPDSDYPHNDNPTIDSLYTAGSSD